MADVVVVGAGVMGSATARSLARAGADVILLEQFRIGHRHGSSHGRSRIFRLSYRDPRYVRMAMETLPRWRELEDEAGQPLLVTTGGLDAGTGLNDHTSALEACGVRFERLPPAEVRERFPTISLDTEALFQEDAGIVAADRAVDAMADSARRHGAEIREETAAHEVRPVPDGVEVETDRETLRTRVAVVTAGAWARGLLGRAGISLPVRPTRESVAYFRVGEGGLPTLVDWGTPAVYALPSPGQGVKAGEHQVGPEADPDEEGAVSAASVARLEEWVRRRYPEADPQPHLAETCLYTNTSDESFIVERHGPVVVGSPCSGHGFKFAPLIGERLARLAAS